MDLFTPKKANGYFTFRVRTECCGQCKKEMIHKPEAHNRTFPEYVDDNLKAQAGRAGLAINSGSEFEGRFVCEDCINSGVVNFVCLLCYKTKKTNEIKASFGTAEHHLCGDCYETVPAKVWDDKVNELNKEHEWD